MIVKFLVFLLCSSRYSLVSWGDQVFVSHSLIRSSVICLSIGEELTIRSRLLLLVDEKSLSSVGIFNRWEFVKISLLVFRERFKMCFICLVRVDESFNLVWLVKDMICNKYSSCGASIVLNRDVIWIGKSFLYLISEVNCWILVFMSSKVGVVVPLPSRKIPRYLIVSSCLRGCIV